jgi:simple sugar transport system permease protein
VNARTTLGYEMRAVGANAKAARFAGIAVDRVMLKTALLSGALAGLPAWAKWPGAPGI